MNKEEFGEKMKAFFTRLGKRNLIIICSVLLVGAIALTNWAIAASRDDVPTGSD